MLSTEGDHICKEEDSVPPQSQELHDWDRLQQGDTGKQTKMDVFGGAPRFLAYPRTVVVQSGNDAVLKCQIGGDPRPTVIWERNNKQIWPQGRCRLFQEGNIYNLIISSVSAEDSGQYICKAKNSIGETYAAATLKVEGEAQKRELREENKPRFLIKPLSTRVGRGEDAVFSCKLWGNPRPEVVWEKDGKKLSEIFESTHFSMSYQDGGWFQLKILKTRAPDGGVYTCKARNEFGEELAGAVLLVDAGPGHDEEGTRNGYSNAQWKSHQSKQRNSRQVVMRQKEEPLPNSAIVKMFAVTEGKHAKFRCFVTGKPKPEILWRKDGRLILSGRRYLLYEDREGYFTLKVLYCKQQDNGVYVCAASNTAGQTLSAVHLTVKEPPVRFKQPLCDLEVWERDLAILECEVPEDSVPTTWYLEDRRLQPGVKYDMEEWGTKRRLTIRDIGADDDGIYLCEMADGGRSIAEVSVRGTIVRKLPRKVDVLEGENAAFCVEVEEEEMDIHWYNDGVELRETHQTIIKSFGKTHILVFVNSSPHDSGIVTFIVGRSKTSTQLRVKAARHCPPSCPVGVQINLERANAALLSWGPAHDSRRNRPLGYVLERQEVGTQEWLQCLTTDSATSVEILGDSVPCEADYRFRIYSVNKYGKSGQLEFPRAAHLVPVAKIQTPLQDALVPEGQDACFTIDLTASVIGTWFLNGTQVQEDDRFSMRRSRTHHFLRIRGVRDTDNGAEITFIAYGIRDSAALYLQEPLVKFTPLSEMDRNKFVEFGNPIVLYCEISDPAAPVHWYKNGVELCTEENLHIQSEGTMRRIVIQSADFCHSGVYRCDAVDDVIRFNVEVEAPPVRFSAVTEAERNLSVEEGCPILLQCEVSDPRAQISWYKDGILLNPETGTHFQLDGRKRILFIESANLSHTGVYSCETKADVIKFKVDVKDTSLRFSELPEAERNKSVEAGCPLLLQCELSNPNAVVWWDKDGTDLFSKPGQEIQSEGCLRRLIIPSTEQSHSGVYRCKSSDDVVAFTVNIEASSVEFSSIPEKEQLKPIETDIPTELQCEHSKASTHFYLYNDESELHPKQNLDKQTNNSVKTLIVPNSELSDRAVYSCQTNHDAVILEEITEELPHSWVYSCAMSDDSAQSNKDIQAGPLRFLSNMEAQKTKLIGAGCPVVLHCELTDASARVHWYKDDIELQQHSNLDIQSEGTVRRLLINSAEPSHSGTYKCDAVDDVILFKVEIQAPPVGFSTVSEAEKSKTVQAGSPIVLQCELTCPSAHVSWSKDGTELQPQSGLDIQSENATRTLIILSADTSHSGVYSCNTKDDSIQFFVDIKDPAVKFTKLPEVERHKCVEAGCPVVLLCELSDPNAPVRWCKDDTELYPKNGLHIQSEGARRRLLIQSAQLEDSGIYSCDAADDIIVFSVDIQAPQIKFSEVTEAEKVKVVQAGSPIILQCELSDPKAQVCWYKDGSQIHLQPGTDIHCEGKIRTMCIKSATLSHAGIYTCETIGDAITFKVDIEASPVTFVEVPEENLHRSVVQLDTLVLSCEISRPDGLTQWYKDGVELQPDSNIGIQAEGTLRKLIIASTQLTDSGTYSCRAGDNALLFQVNIREPPLKIVYPKEDVHLDRHVPEEVVLSCELSRPNGVVHWYRDGQRLQESENIKLKSEGPYRRLKILHCNIEDSGEYVCDTADDSIFFQLSVTEAPVRIISPSQSQMELCQQTSEQMILSCEISRPNASVRWYRDGLEIEENENLILEVDGVYRRLIIPQTTVQDSAEYVCDTVDDSVTFIVNIAEPPVRFVRPRKMASIVEGFAGDTLVLECEVSRPNAQVCWKKNGEEIGDSRNITVIEDGILRHLTIHSLTLMDNGKYTCDAKDDVMDFQVNVSEKPIKILKKAGIKTEFNSLVSDDIVLECEISSPKGIATWCKDGAEIAENERIYFKQEGVFHSLVITSCVLTDSGKYICDIEDGLDNMIFNVNVEEYPVNILGNSGSPEQHTLSAGDDLILECEVSRANAEVDWYCNGSLLSADSRTHIESHGTYRKLVLSKLRPSDSGIYTCDAIDDKMVTMLKVEEPTVKVLNKGDSGVVTALESESVTFSTKVHQQNATVHWLKEGKSVSGGRFRVSREGNNHFLTITDLLTTDSGNYECKANNNHVHFKLWVKGMRVKFVQPLENMIAQKDGAATLRCELNQAKGDVQWFKDGHGISPGCRFVIRAYGCERSLTIHNLTVNDGGHYACESTHDRTTATVIVKKLPIVEFIAEISNTTVIEGEDAAFKCMLSLEDVQLVWHKDGCPIGTDGRFVPCKNGLCHTLHIHKCQLSDSCKITAVAEGKVSKATLHVKESQVVFTKKLKPMVCEEYGDVTLEVEVSVACGEVQWMRQGVLIQPGHGRKFTLKESGKKRSLTLHKVSVSERGCYRCETLHDYTQSELSVEPRRITIRKGLFPLDAFERETATFEVELSQTNIEGVWQKDGISLKPNNHFDMSAKGHIHRLTISNLTVEDNGTVTFAAQSAKTSARLTVKEIPVVFLRKTEDLSITEGALVSIECELSRQNIDVKWLKNGSEVTNGKNIRIYSMGKKRFLQILKCDIGDTGVYTCDAGETHTSCALDVYERQVYVVNGLENVDIQEGQNAVFTCEVSIEDVPGEWYKKGERILTSSTIKMHQEGTKHFLLICNVKADDSGKIMFVARQVESVAYLHVEELPKKIVKPLEDTSAVENEKVILHCTVSNPRCSIRWYHGKNVILPSEHFEICSEGCIRKLVIQQVSLHDDGMYSVQVGENISSARLTVDAQSPPIVRCLEDVHVEAPEEACFECETSGPFPGAPVWTLNGEILHVGSDVQLESCDGVHRLTFTQTSEDMSGVVVFNVGNAKSSAKLHIRRYFMR